MILTIDVGNTNITCGVFDEDVIVASFRITTKMPRTSDEYGMILYNLLEQNNIQPMDIGDAIICSVVPNVMHSLRGGLVKYFHITPIIVEAGIKTGIRIVTPNPQQIGADRIVDAVGAYEIYGGPVLVIDFGTATTYDFVDESGAFLEEFEAAYEVYLKTEDMEGLQQDYNELLVNMNRQVRVLDPKEPFEGKAMGITKKGELIVDTWESRKLVSSGEVSVRGIYGYV